MFRRLPNSLPQDPYFPPDLEKLGYFINDKSQVRMIGKEQQKFRYHITNNERYNELHNQAYHRAICLEIASRMKSAGMSKLYLPQMTTTRPEGPSMPVYITKPSHLKDKKRIVVVINDTGEELGCWSFRAMNNEHGLDAGSAVALAEEVKNRDDIGLIVLNPGSILYSYEYGRAMTLNSWRDRRRPSMVHQTHVTDPVLNHIPGNENASEHIQFVFEKVINNPEFVDPSAKIELVGLSDGGNEIVGFLNKNWSVYSSRVSAIALVSPFFGPESITSSSFKKALRRRARTWIISSAPVNAVIQLPGVQNRYNEVSFTPVLAGGEDFHGELIFPTSFKAILDWFDEVNKLPVGAYRNPPMEVVPFDGTESPEDSQGQDDEREEENVKEQEEKVEIAGVEVSKSLAEKAGLF